MYLCGSIHLGLFARRRVSLIRQKKKNEDKQCFLYSQALPSETVAEVIKKLQSSGPSTSLCEVKLLSDGIRLDEKSSLQALRIDSTKAIRADTHRIL